MHFFFQFDCSSLNIYRSDKCVGDKKTSESLLHCISLIFRFQTTEKKKVRAS